MRLAGKSLVLQSVTDTTAGLVGWSQRDAVKPD